MPLTMALMFPLQNAARSFFESSPLASSRFQTSFSFRYCDSVSDITDLGSSLVQNGKTLTLSKGSLAYLADGKVYDENQATATNKMSLGSTYVYGVYRDYVFKFEGLTVLDEKIHLSLAKSTSDITSGSKCLFVYSPSKAFIKGYKLVTLSGVTDDTSSLISPVT